VCRPCASSSCRRERALPARLKRPDRPVLYRRTRPRKGGLADARSPDPARVRAAATGRDVSTGIVVAAAGASQLAWGRPPLPSGFARAWHGVKARHLWQVTVTRSSSDGSGGFGDQPESGTGRRQRRAAGARLARLSKSRVTAGRQFSAICAARRCSPPGPPVMLPCPRSRR
jgi:hypothetical protein